MRRRISQKAQRVLEFLVGLGDPRARAALARFNFTRRDVDEGWNRLRALSEVPMLLPASPGPAIVRGIDEWENQWFPIIGVILRTNFPDVHEVVFLNLVQTEGVEVLVSVRTLIDRLEAISLPEEEGGLGERGRAARAYLEHRGVTDELLEEGRRLLAQVGQGPSTDEPIFDPDARAKAEAHLWSWYLEWSGIARAAIKEPSVLASLGFRARGRKKIG